MRPDGRYRRGDPGGGAALAWNLPIATEPCATVQTQVAVGAEQGVTSRVPSLQILLAERGGYRDIHSVPCVPNAGKLPVTITAATLPVRMVKRHDIDVHPFQHRLQRLFGKGDVVEGIAGAVEAVTTRRGSRSAGSCRKPSMLGEVL